MTTAVKTGLIIALALTMNGIGSAEGNKINSGLKTGEQMKTAITSGQSSTSSTEEENELYLFPLTKAFLNEL
jgi:hypothetical protein